MGAGQQRVPDGHQIGGQPKVERDYSKCDVCGLPQDADKMHVVIDNGIVTRHTYAHRRHRYVVVPVPGTSASGSAAHRP